MSALLDELRKALPMIDDRIKCARLMAEQYPQERAEYERQVKDHAERKALYQRWLEQEEVNHVHQL